MRKNNNKTLYEKIMRNVAKELKKALNENTQFSLESFNEYIREIKNQLDLPADIEQFFTPSVGISHHRKDGPYFIIWSRDEDLDIDHEIIDEEEYKDFMYDLYYYFSFKYKDEFDYIRFSYDPEQYIFKCYVIINNDNETAAEIVYKILKEYIDKVNDKYEDYELNKLEEKRRYNKRYKYLY